MTIAGVEDDGVTYRILPVYEDISYISFALFSPSSSSPFRYSHL